jgi:hypothetical protein
MPPVLDKRVLQEITSSRKTAPAIEIGGCHLEGKSPGAGVGAVADRDGFVWSMPGK